MVVTICSSAVMLSISKTLKAPASAVARGYRTIGVSVRSFSGVPPTPHASTSMDQMMSDKRYTPVSAVPSSLIDDAQSDMVHSPGFSIKGQAKAGRPAYLDFQATTPTDPRVVDAMVCVLPTHIHTYIHTHSLTHSLTHIYAPLHIHLFPRNVFLVAIHAWKIWKSPFKNPFLWVRDSV